MRRGPTGVLIAAVVGLLLVPMGPPAHAADVSTATGSSYGVKIGGPVTISARPTASVTATTEDPMPSPVDQVVLNIPAAPVVTSGTFRAAASAAVVSGLTAKLQSLMNARADMTPADHNARGYAAVENLAALPGNVITADVVEAEAVARCSDNKTTFATAARVTDIKALGITLPQVVTATPNQVLIDQPLLGLKVVLWETNWDPSTGGTNDGSNTVFVNALRVTQSLLGIDLVASHAEATGACAAAAADAVLPTVLPRTGGGPFTVIGLALLAAAALGVFLRRRVLRTP